MLEFRLEQAQAFPIGRQAKLNRAHPLFSQKNFISALVAQGSGLRDLVTGVYGTNTTTLSGVDENGPYVWSNDAAGTGTVNIAGPATGFQFICWGAIFKMIGAGRQFVSGFSSNWGFALVPPTISFSVAGGSVVNFTGISGHTYFALETNAVTAAAQTRNGTLVDLTAGRVFQFTGGSAGGVIAVNPIGSLVVTSAQVAAHRLYASFITGSVLVPPAVNPAATFFSPDQIMSGTANPWALWYA